MKWTKWNKLLDRREIVMVFKWPFLPKLMTVAQIIKHGYTPICSSWSSSAEIQFEHLLFLYCYEMVVPRIGYTAPPCISTLGQLNTLSNAVEWSPTYKRSSLSTTWTHCIGNYISLSHAFTHTYAFHIPSDYFILILKTAFMHAHWPKLGDFYLLQRYIAYVRVDVMNFAHDMSFSCATLNSVSSKPLWIAHLIASYPPCDT
jgi:hypothetical protein